VTSMVRKLAWAICPIILMAACSPAPNRTVVSRQDVEAADGLLHVPRPRSLVSALLKKAQLRPSDPYLVYIGAPYLTDAGAHPLGVGSQQESLFLDLLAEAVDREFPEGTRDSIYNACFEGYSGRDGQGRILESLTRKQRQALEARRVIDMLESQRGKRKQ
jgi:hypothetical protein